MMHRILIVDDHPDAADLACMLLSALGHECRAATSGTEGLAAAAEFAPDIAIVDIGLPDISGYEVAHALRATYGPSIYLAAVTGWGQPDDLRRAQNAGFDQHVLKPADATKLRGVLAAAERAHPAHPA
ncbi:MAG: response regulator [Deltaproteobacteria bacterium]|nr:response regulator [Deltaproteobacteria bacterium]MCW5805126.1 response regulator [Deltaproteobacteria bacterium]